MPISKSPKRRHLTTNEAAKLLQVSAGTIRNMCERGELKGAKRIGDWWRIPKTAVAEYYDGPIEDEDAVLT